MKEQYVIRNGDDVQGWAYTTYLHTGMHSVYLLNQIYVVPEHRNKRVATQILTQVANHADWENAVIFLDFQPAEFNSDATRLQSFYERFGFTWDATIGGMRREPQ